MNDVYSSRPLKRKKCKRGFVEVNGVCVPIREAPSSFSQSFNTRPPPTPPTPPTPPEPKKEIDTIQPRNSDLGLIGTVVGTTIGVGGVGYGAYRNRGAIQRNMRRMTQRKMKVDEEQGLLQEDEDFFRSQQSTTGQRVRQRNVSRRPSEMGTAEERSPFLRRTPRGSDIEMKTTRVTTTTESEGQFFEPQKPPTMSGEEQEAADRLTRIFQNEVDDAPPDEIPTLEELAGKTKPTKAETQIAKDAIKDASKDVKGSKMKFGGESEAPIDDGNPFNIPIEDRPTISEVGGGKTSVIDDMVEGISKKGGDIPPVENIDPFIESIGANEEAVIGAGEAAAGIAGATTFTEVAAAVVPELGVALVLGGVAYGLQKGVEEVLDIGAEQDKKYHDKRNTEEGSHEMDQREISYKIKELDAAKKYYKDQVEHHNFGDSEASKAQHEQDKAMLNSIQKSIDSLTNHYESGEPVYVVVGSGFDKDDLNSADKKEYDRLVKRVQDEQEQVNYHGADKQRLENRQRKLDRFIGEHSDSSVANAYVNKATEEELQQITDEYIKNGGDIFEGVDPEMMSILGIADAIGTDEVQTQRMEIEEDEKNVETTDDVAASQGLVTTVDEGVGSIM